MRMPQHRPALIVALAALLWLSLPTVPPARADGDPASDVLLGLNVYYPYMPPVTAALQKKLDSETAAAAKAHFPIKVALIVSPIDLGVIPQLFGKPQKYASFLDQEISFQAPQPLLVVMAVGYGDRGLSPAAQAAVASLPKPAGATSNDLARAAAVAVAMLAQAAGHPLNAASGATTASGGGGGRAVLVIVLALAAILTTTALLVLRHRQAATRRP
jgi:hypothetical protein